MLQIKLASWVWVSVVNVIDGASKSHGSSEELEIARTKQTNRAGDGRGLKRS